MVREQFLKFLYETDNFNKNVIDHQHDVIDDLFINCIIDRFNNIIDHRIAGVNDDLCGTSALLLNLITC